MNIYISSHSNGATAVGSIGLPHYSYLFAAESHKTALELLKARMLPLEQSWEMSSKSWTRTFESSKDQNVHLMIKNFRSLRPVSWAYNIAIIVWEFDELAGDEFARDNAFRDQIRMLRTCDEFWVATNHTKSVFEAAGLKNVHIIPAPVELHAFETDRAHQTALANLLRKPSITLEQGVSSVPIGRQPAFEQRGRLYCSMLNPLDPRKQLLELCDAFADFRSRNPDAVLLLKLSVNPKRYPIERLMTDVLSKRILGGGRYPVESNGIILFNSFLDDAELSAFHHLSDFHVSLSHGEGQNLPLQEAMSVSRPVIAQDHTAMADYLDPSNSIKVASRKRKAPPGLRPSYHFEQPVDWYHSTARQLGQALDKSAALSQAERTNMGELARKTILENYSSFAVAKKMSKRLGIETYKLER